MGGGLGQTARTLLSRKGFNQYAMTALCAVLASGVYCLIVLGFGVRSFSLAHAVGFISSVLFLVPGFPLVAALLDLVQHQTTAGDRPAVLRRAADAWRPPSACRSSPRWRASPGAARSGPVSASSR